MKATGPCLGEHGPAISSNVFEKLHTIQKKKIRQHREMSWTVFGGAPPSVHLNLVEDFAQHQNKMNLQRRVMSWAVTGDLGERPLAINLNLFTWLHNIQTKTFFNTVKGTGPCLREHNSAISSNVFQKLHTIQIRRVFKSVKCVLPCLGEHDQPFIWTLLNVCKTTKQNDSSKTRSELGRDRGCWGARPSYKFEGFYMAAEHPYN